MFTRINIYENGVDSWTRLWVQVSVQCLSHIREINVHEVFPLRLNRTLCRVNIYAFRNILYWYPHTKVSMSCLYRESTFRFKVHVNKRNPFFMKVYNHIMPLYLHFIRNALKSIKSFEWYLPITARSNHFWCRNIRTTFFHGNIAQLHQFTHI